MSLHSFPMLVKSPPTDTGTHTYTYTLYTGTHTHITHTNTHSLYWNSVVQLKGKLLMWLMCTNWRKMLWSSSSARGRKTFYAKPPLFFLPWNIKNLWHLGGAWRVEGSYLRHCLNDNKLSSFQPCRTKK